VLIFVISQAQIYSTTEAFLNSTIFRNISGRIIIMNTYLIIKNLADQQKISVSELERKLNLSNGSISKWAKSKPNSKYLEKVADYFNVSTDYLLGRNKDVEDPISYFRIDTTGLSKEEIADMKKELSDYAQYLKSKVQGD
jgi:transcriptional regulator with XRE-family HTH domain